MEIVSVVAGLSGGSRMASVSEVHEVSLHFVLITSGTTMLYMHNDVGGKQHPTFECGVQAGPPRKLIPQAVLQEIDAGKRRD